MTADEGDKEKQRPQNHELSGIVVAYESDEDDQPREEYQRRRDNAMKASGFEARPRIHEVHDLAPFVGVGARALAWAGVAHLRACAVPQQAAFVVVLV